MRVSPTAKGRDSATENLTRKTAPATVVASDAVPTPSPRDTANPPDARTGNVTAVTVDPRKLAALFTVGGVVPAAFKFGRAVVKRTEGAPPWLLSTHNPTGCPTAV